MEGSNTAYAAVTSRGVRWATAKREREVQTASADRDWSERSPFGIAPGSVTESEGANRPSSEAGSDRRSRG